ncbi:formimidoylglutamase [Planococcus faecalis]|uniref:Formimidoylglutamase n=1 Tax=Planococcus faecalis TaxID=1598147 RepID=A0ABM6IPE6_9BACL|nr:formimidoylglutamase [Planococcus faecalis]AQU78415.1 formimidoylglutamase [Planococcus faecalis]OHX52389.1 formimidoylglutamase [Planococcus faecalis]
MYKLPTSEHWQGRIDSNTDPDSFRFHQAVQTQALTSLSAEPEAFAIVGFECEEGVRRNKGRLGAAAAPDQIRSKLASLPYNFDSCQKTFDVGNVVCEGQALEHAQQELGTAICKLLEQAATPIILGGGHETLYGHYLGVREFAGKDAKIGLINIDAHFDLRQAEHPSSGTMFRQILESDTNAGYLCLGVQTFGNTPALFKTAELLGCKYMMADELTLSDMPNAAKAIDEFCAQYDVVLATLCTDSINAAAAPGVSAPSPLGLDPLMVCKLLRYIMSKKNVKSFDISEVNPSLDEQQRTVKLAAYLVAEVMDGFTMKHREEE